MRRRHVFLTVVLLAPLAVVALLTWLIVGALHAQERPARSGAGAAEHRSAPGPRP